MKCLGERVSVQLLGRSRMISCWQQLCGAPCALLKLIFAEQHKQDEARQAAEALTEYLKDEGYMRKRKGKTK
eukprot:1452676-Amphidinium_carterae.1